MAPSTTVRASRARKVPLKRRRVAWAGQPIFRRKGQLGSFRPPRERKGERERGAIFWSSQELASVITKLSLTYLFFSPRPVPGAINRSAWSPASWAVRWREGRVFLVVIGWTAGVVNPRLRPTTYHTRGMSFSLAKPWASFLSSSPSCLAISTALPSYSAGPFSAFSVVFAICPPMSPSEPPFSVQSASWPGCQGVCGQGATHVNCLLSLPCPLSST